MPYEKWKNTDTDTVLTNGMEIYQINLQNLR